MTKKIKNVFIFFIIISIGFSFIYYKERFNVEKNYKNFATTVQYSDFTKLANEEDKSINDYFKELRQNNISSVSIDESTINSMKNDLNLNISTYIKDLKLFVTGDKESLELIIKGLNSLKKSREIKSINENTISISLLPKDIITFNRNIAYDNLGTNLGYSGYGNAIEYISLGIDKRKVNNLKNANVSIILRPTVNGRYQDERKVMNRFFEDIDKYSKNQKYILFSGKEAFKNTNNDKKIQSDFIKEINKRKLSIALIEASNQRGNLKIDGLDAIIKDPNVSKLRIFTTWDYIQNEYDYKLPHHHEGEELTNVYYRAITERNIDDILIKPFIKNNKFITNPKVYGKILENLKIRLEKQGYKFGDIKPMGKWYPNSIYKIPISFGVVAAGLLLLNLFWKINLKKQLILFILGCGLSVLFFGLNKAQNFGNMLFNLLAIIIYPSLSIAYILKKYIEALKTKSKLSFLRIFSKSILILLISIIISIIGSLMEISYLSNTDYLLEIITFKGVKLSQIMPIIMSIFLYLAYIGYNREKYSNPNLNPFEIRKLLNLNVKIWQVCFVGGIFVVLGIFLLRGGNTNAKVPGIELYIRNLLENYLPARPRTKSILFGYPAIFLLIFLGYRKKYEILTCILIIFVAIGQADIVNTFSHIRTPLSMSFNRIIIEFLVSIMISFIFLLIIDWLIKKNDELFKEKK